MFTVMESAKPSVFPADNKQGVDRVTKSKRMYAFFMESSVLEYITERNCEVRQVGGLLDSKSYAIALPMSTKNFLYKQMLYSFLIFFRFTL